MHEVDELALLATQLRGQLNRWKEQGTLRVPAASPKSPQPVSEIPSPGTSPSPSLGSAALRLAQVREALGNCTRCKLHTSRTNIVFGTGSPEASLVFVGEAPGMNEDQQGEPFVGDAGQLLTKMIEAMGWSRQSVYICNVLRCRPPGNRNPEKDEVAQCEPFLKQTLAAIRPRMIVALGKFAAQCLTGKPDAPISALRGVFHTYEGIQVMPTYHPAYLLRTPSAKRTVWEDLKAVMAEMERLGMSPHK